jgi:hypothetical protein
MSMAVEHSHVSDATLLLYEDGCLSVAHASEVELHLGGCEKCSARLREMTGTLAEFAHLQRRAQAKESPAADQLRATLIARIAESPKNSPRNAWNFWFPSAVMPAWKGFAIAGVLLLVVSLGAVYRRELRKGANQVSASVALWSEPNSNLTPGTVLPATTTQLCTAPHEKLTPVVPASLRRKVLAVYGVSDSAADAYEVDYLITPQLGGATDIRNLWPQPYFDTVWNAHVKDQLEDRLYEMVCRGDVDLATAQRDISNDWIAAYRKYFHTEDPIDENSSRRL